MKKYTIQQYIKMSQKFNKMTPSKQIETILKNNDILRFKRDLLEYVVMLCDSEMQENLELLGHQFKLKKETNEYLLAIGDNLK